MKQYRLTPHSRATRWLFHWALSAACGSACAQQSTSAQALPQVTVSGQSSQPVEKSFRKMMRGLDYFAEHRAAMAPDATLRFKLLPRKPGTDMDHVVLEVIGKSFDYKVPIAPDRTFALTRDPLALQEDAFVSPNRKRLSMTWRAEIRSLGVPANVRRLGDLRLECEVGLEAGLVSNSGPIGLIADLFTNTQRYCDRKDSKYMFFADRPVFSVTLKTGARREVLSIDQLYASASDDPDLKADLPFCDCEMLVDRTYFLPLGDHSWPDDTRVEFEFMDGHP